MKRLLVIALSIIITLSSLNMFGCSGLKTDVNGVKADVTFSVNVDNHVENGSIKTNKKTVVFGESVKFTLTPDEGYSVHALYLNGGEIKLNTSTYTIPNVLRDYTATAKFAKTDVTVHFTGEHTSGVGDKIYQYNSNFSELPVLKVYGKTFLGWKDQDGNFVTETTLVQDTDGYVELTSVFSINTEEYKEAFYPYAITVSYYDDTASRIGITWHSKARPLQPVVYVQKGNTVNISTARQLGGLVKEWNYTTFGKEYIVTCAVNLLEDATTYTVTLGDSLVGAMSRPFTFTTKDKVIEDLSFVFVTDSKQKESERINYGETTFMAETLRDALNRFPNADMILHGGDFVNDGAYSCQWQEMIDSIEEFTFEYPMMVLSGEHQNPKTYNDVAIKNSVDLMYYVNYPGKTNGYKMENGVFFSFDYGPAHVVALNTNDLYLNQNKITVKQLEWFINDVYKAKSSGAKWIVLLMHQGPVSPTHQSEFDLTLSSVFGHQIIPLIDELGIDLVISGHNYYTASSYPLSWNENLSNDDLSNDKLKTVVVKTDVQKIVHDGDMVDKFSLEGERGTIYHQTGSCGGTISNEFKYSNDSKNLSNHPRFRSLISGSKDGNAIGKDLRTYSYVEITKDALILRTYGVDAMARFLSNENKDQYGYYLDGFMITK